MNNPISSTTHSTRSNCLRAVGVSCLVVVIAGIAMGFFFVNLLTKNPVFRRIYKEAQSIAQCQLNLQEIGGALDRYSRRNGKYPATLEELYPNFLEKRSFLHCPADPRRINVISYKYTPPTIKSPPSTTVIECKRHVVLEGQPPWIVSLHKDGKVFQRGYGMRKVPRNDR